MSLGVDDYLTWTPADMAQGAVWLRLKANDMEMTATAIRNAAADGTAGQCGAFIDARRDEAHDIADRVQKLAEFLGGAATALSQASADLGSAVARLRDDCATIDDEGFERFDGFHVRDARTEYADAADRNLREQRAKELQDELKKHMGDIRAYDERADRALHAVVDRPVRDRTPEGNGDPSAVGLTTVSGIGALTSGAAALAEENWKEAARAAGRGLITVRGLGPAAMILGFAGGVADRPEDEPLLEAIAAEGVGTAAAAAAIPVGMFFGARAGLPGVIAGGVGGFFASPFVGQSASSKMRDWFDSEN